MCEVVGKPQTITFQSNVGSTVVTLQDPSNAAILFNGSVDDDGVSFVVVTDQSSASTALSGGGKQFFRGDVAFDGLFEASNAVTSFGAQTCIHFFDDSSGGLLRTVTYHTSCSQPIQLQDVIGNATLLGYTGASGSQTAQPPGLGDPAPCLGRHHPVCRQR